MEENFSMEWNMEENFVWNGIWKKILVWNGNGMEENCQYGIWKNHLPFHSIPCLADYSPVAFEVNECIWRSLSIF